MLSDMSKRLVNQEHNLKREQNEAIQALKGDIGKVNASISEQMKAVEVLLATLSSDISSSKGFQLNTL